MSEVPEACFLVNDLIDRVLESHDITCKEAIRYMLDELNNMYTECENEEADDGYED